MRRSMKRFCRVLVLAAVMVVPLLLVAGPALAVSPFDGNPPGKQLDGKHDINGRLIETYRDVQEPPVEYLELVEYDVRSSDSRLSGEMVLYVWDAEILPNGNVLFRGFWEIFRRRWGSHLECVLRGPGERQLPSRQALPAQRLRDCGGQRQECGPVSALSRPSCLRRLDSSQQVHADSEGLHRASASRLTPVPPLRRARAV